MDFNPYIKISTRISAGVDDFPCFSTFIAMIPIDCKITIFFLTHVHLLYLKLVHTASKERMIIRKFTLHVPNYLFIKALQHKC